MSLFFRSRRSTDDAASDFSDRSDDSLRHDDSPFVSRNGPYSESACESDSFDSHAYLDYGCLLLPKGLGCQISTRTEEQCVECLFEQSGLRVILRVLAVPTHSQIWDSVRTDMMLGIAKSGGRSTQEDSDWGTCLHVVFSDNTPAFICGIEGRRWLLLVSAEGTDAHHKGPDFVHNIIDNCVVIRGQAPHLPREALEVRSPEDALPEKESRYGA